MGIAPPASLPARDDRFSSSSRVGVPRAVPDGITDELQPGCNMRPKVPLQAPTISTPA